MAKKYYWLKLKEDFFDDDTIAYIEEQENGESYVNFYLKLCLKSLKTDGKMVRLVGDSFIPYDVNSLAKLTRTPPDTVRVAMELFQNIGLIKVLDTGELYLSQMNELIGSETDKAAIMRRKRAEEKALGNNVTAVLPKCYTEIEIEKEIETDKELLHKQPKRKVFKPPTVDEVREYCQQRNNTVDAERFIDYYSTGGWFLRKGVKMKDWKAAVRTWERNENERTGNKRPQGTQRHSDEDYTKGLEGFRGWDD